MALLFAVLFVIDTCVEIILHLSHFLIKEVVVLSCFHYQLCVCVFQGHEDTIKNDGLAIIFLNQSLPPATFYYSFFI